MGDDSARGLATDHAELRVRLERHHREGYAWALSCCGWNAVEAENVLQSVYVKILEGSAVYAGRSAFRTWLFAVIRHTAAQERRRNWWLGRKTVNDDDALERASIEDDPTDAIYRAELRAHLQKALAALPSRQREVIALVFHHELTLDQAAEVMRVSPGSARRHYDRGKQRLRQWIESTQVIDERRSGTRA
jgi:RNA polymerase sigma factor (sigma-70 family)